MYGRLNRIYYSIPDTISSQYWYGKNKKGSYIIRQSDHWNKVATCTWCLTKQRKNYNKIPCGKIYLKQ